VRLFGVSLSLLALGTLALLGAEENLVSQGFDHFYNLEYDQAQVLFQQAAARDPNSADVHNHLAETILFREMLRDGALESELVSGDNSFLRRAKLNPSPETQREFLNDVSAAISLASKRIEGNPNDTGALYALGIAYGLRANYNWLVNKSWRESLRDATAARRNHNRITELEPSNVDATLVQGLHDYVVGNLPLVWRMLGLLGGIRGDKETGIQTVEDVARRGDRNRVDAQILLCALYRRENQPMKAVPLVEDLMRRYPRNYLLPLELSQMYSMAGDGQKAIAAVEALSRAKAARTPGLDRVTWEKIYFQEGTIQFWYRDLDHSLANLNKVAAAADNLDLNTGAFAYLRIGQIYDMTRRRDQAISAYKKCIAFAPEADAARESRKYLAAPYRRL